MYQNFFNDKILEVLFWMMDHTGEHSASLIFEETSLTQYTLVQYLHLLYTLDVCDVDADEDNEELFVTLKEDSKIVQSIRDIQDVLDNKMNETGEIEMVLSQESTQFNDLLDDISQLDANQLLDLCDEMKEAAEKDDMDVDDIIELLQIVAEEKKQSENEK